MPKKKAKFKHENIIFHTEKDSELIKKLTTVLQDRLPEE